MNTTPTPPTVIEPAGAAWVEQPHASGWWWWYHPDQAPLGVVALIHDDNEAMTENWWVYLPRHARPQRLSELPDGGRWSGPITKPQMPRQAIVAEEQMKAEAAP